MMEAPLYPASSVLFFLRMIPVKGWEFEWFSFSRSSVFGGFHSFQGLSAGVALPALQKLVLWWDCPKSMMRSYIGWIQNLLKWHWKCSSVFSWRAHFADQPLWCLLRCRAAPHLGVSWQHPRLFLPLNWIERAI